MKRPRECMTCTNTVDPKEHPYLCPQCKLAWEKIVDDPKQTLFSEHTMNARRRSRMIGMQRYTDEGDPT
jgi:hypothetical protein